MSRFIRVAIFGSVVGAGALLAGCASTTIYPEGKNRYSLISTSSSEGSAEAAAKKKAEKACVKKAKHLVVLDHQTVYQGVKKDKKAILNLAGALFTGQIGAANSNQDYKVTLHFKCA